MLPQSFNVRLVAWFAATIFTMVAGAVLSRGAELPPFPQAAIAPEPVRSITVSWRANTETNICGYFVKTNGSPIGFTTNNSLVLPYPDERMGYTVSATNSAGLEGAESYVVMFPDLLKLWTNIVNFSASGVSIWNPVEWTNVTGTKLFKVVYPTSTKARVMTATNALGPWTQWTNWPTAITTNRRIALRMQGRVE